MNFDVVRAWKDEEYRLSLSDEERLGLPENPVGELELTDADLEVVYGGGKGKHHSSGGGGGGGGSNGCNNSHVCSVGCISNGNCNSFFCF